MTMSRTFVLALLALVSAAVAPRAAGAAEELTLLATVTRVVNVPMIVGLRLLEKEDGVKVTISLSKRSVDFFKSHARKSKIPYQRMIRRVLDEYASAYSSRNRRG